VPRGRATARLLTITDNQIDELVDKMARTIKAVA
jgi:hypothetical protein